MYSQTSIGRLKDIRTRIEHIAEICKDYDGILEALDDEKIAKPAIIMHLIVCNENLQKLQYEVNVLDFFSSSDIRGLKAIRNLAAHDYDGLNTDILYEVLKEYLPPIAKKLDDFFANLDSPTQIDGTKTNETNQGTSSANSPKHRKKY